MDTNIKENVNEEEYDYMNKEPLDSEENLEDEEEVDTDYCD